MRVQVSGLQLTPRQHVHGHCLRAAAQRWCCRQRGALRGMADGVFICGGSRAITEWLRLERTWRSAGLTSCSEQSWLQAHQSLAQLNSAGLQRWRSHHLSRYCSGTAPLSVIRWDPELPLSLPVASCPPRIFVTPSNSIRCKLTWQGTLLLRPKKETLNPHSGHFLCMRRNSDLLQISLGIATNLLKLELANPQSHWRHNCNFYLKF